jgi:hypothetical protein
MAAPSTLDQLGEMTTGFKDRTRERHSSTVKLDGDSLRYGTTFSSRSARASTRWGWW